MSAGSILGSQILAGKPLVGKTNEKERDNFGKVSHRHKKAID